MGELLLGRAGLLGASAWYTFRCAGVSGLVPNTRLSLVLFFFGFSYLSSAAAFREATEGAG